MYPNSITPAMVSVAMSRSDSRDSTTSSTSDYQFTSAPQTVLYSTSPMAAAPSMTRTISNTSSTSSYSSMRRASQITQRRESSNWIPSPYRSCQQTADEPTSFLSDDDLLWIAPTKRELPVTSIPTVTRRQELTTEEQIAMLREQQEREQEGELIRLQQQRRQAAAAAAQKAVRFAPEAKRRSSSHKKKATPVARRS